MSTLKTTNLQNASAASPAIVLAADGSATAQVSSLNGGPLAGTRNRIINGDMQISQRGTSFATLDPATVTYTLDRFLFGGGGTTARATITQDTDVPNSTFQYSLKVDVTTADAAVAASDRAHIVQHIEGFNVRDLIGTTFTLSFWVKSPKTGTHCVSFQSGIFPPDRSFITTYNVNSANTWEYKTITVSGGLITAGTWNWTNGIGLTVRFVLMAGTDFQSTAGTWLTGNLHATSAQVNVLDSTSNDFYLTGVQLEPGTVATPFERRSYGQELVLCQRYYSAGNYYCVLPAGSSGTLRRDRVPFPVAMRATSVTVNDGAGNTNKVYRNANNQSMTIFNYDPLAFAISVTTGGAATGDDLFFNWTCTGEL